MAILTNSVLSFPSQKLPDSRKTKVWIKEVVKAAEGIAVYSDNMVRRSKSNMQINYDLFNDILNSNDVERITNLFKIKGAIFYYSNYGRGNLVSGGNDGRASCILAKVI